MPDASVQQVISYVSGLGGTGILILFSYLWFTGKIVTRRELDSSEQRNEQLKAERDEWKDAALRSLNLAERSESKTDRVIDVVSRTVRGSKKVSDE